MLSSAELIREFDLIGTTDLHVPDQEDMETATVSKLLALVSLLFCHCCCQCEGLVVAIPFMHVLPFLSFSPPPFTLLYFLSFLCLLLSSLLRLYLSLWAPPPLHVPFYVCSSFSFPSLSFLFLCCTPELCGGDDHCSEAASGQPREDV